MHVWKWFFLEKSDTSDTCTTDFADRKIHQSMPYAWSIICVYLNNETYIGSTGDYIDVAFISTYTNAYVYEDNMDGKTSHVANGQHSKATVLHEQERYLPS